MSLTCGMARYGFMSVFSSQASWCVFRISTEEKTAVFQGIYAKFLSTALHKKPPVVNVITYRWKLIQTHIEHCK